MVLNLTGSVREINGVRPAHTSAVEQGLAGADTLTPGGVRLAHTSAVEQGLAAADTFARCRRSFLTWMAGTPMSQLNEQGTD
eukprot:gene19917-26621_t